MKQLPEDIRTLVRAATGASGIARAERIQRLWSGYGEILRLTLHGAPVASVIVKLVQPGAAKLGERDDEQRSHARKLRSYAVEHAFYQRYAGRCGVDCRVARPLRCEQRAGQWLFILEDLDAAGFGERRSTVPLHAARTCLRWLAHFHATFMAEPPQHLWPQGSYWRLDTRPDELARMHDVALRTAASDFDAQLRAARHQTLIHGDAKLANFCFAPALRDVAAVDFQYVGAGCGVQDVAYFLSCLDDSTCQSHAAALLDDYFQTLRHALGANHPTIDGADVEAEWRALYPIAWADFYRFMNGWAPGERPSPYAARMIALALTTR